MTRKLDEQFWDQVTDDQNDQNHAQQDDTFWDIVEVSYTDSDCESITAVADEYLQASVQELSAVNGMPVPEELWEATIRDEPEEEE